jgi:integrase
MSPVPSSYFLKALRKEGKFIFRRGDMGLPWDAVLDSTRHTAQTDLGAAGAVAFTIQAIAGHASVMTLQYVRKWRNWQTHQT